MWTRKFTQSLYDTMALDPKEFTKVLIAALNDKSVQEKLQDVICTNLKQEITILNQKLVQRDQQINHLENKVQSLENKCDDLFAIFKEEFLKNHRDS